MMSGGKQHDLHAACRAQLEGVAEPSAACTLQLISQTSFARVHLPCLMDIWQDHLLARPSTSKTILCGHVTLSRTSSR